MSLQAGIRRKGCEISGTWESNIFGYAFDLFEQVRQELNVPNLHEFADNELGPDFDLSDEEIDEMEERLPEDEEEFAADMLIRQRGSWYDPAQVAPVVVAYREYFEAQPPEQEFTAKRWIFKASDIASDLRNLENEIKASEEPFRICVG